MAVLTDRLAAGGVLRPAEVIEVAAQAGLELAVAATVLERESSGGRNVWGSDPVDPGGAYVKGAAVSEQAYRAYARARDAGRIKAQGVGPCQLTYPPLQREADALGGCWVPRWNMLVGFRHLAGLQCAHGERGGFRRYNGSGPAAERYADEAMAQLAEWRQRLDGATVPTATAGLRYGERGEAVRKLQRFLIENFPRYAKFDPTGFYGSATAAAVAEFQRQAGVAGPDADGMAVGPRTLAALVQHGYQP